MYEVSREMLYVIVGVPILAVVGYVLLIVFAFSPIYVLLFGVLFLIISHVSSWNTEVPARINCSECGAPNETDRDHCEYCAAALDTADDA